MFASRYFPARYFPGRYFGTSLGLSVQPLHPATFEVELSGVGSGYTDITSHVLITEDTVIRHGINGGGAQDLLAPPASATFTLRNDANMGGGGVQGYYSRFHASRRVGWDLGINCRITFTDMVTTISYVVFVGRIDTIYPTAGVNGQRVVRVTAVGWLDEALAFEVGGSLGDTINLRESDIFTTILALMPRQPAATSIAPGVDVFPYSLDTSGDRPETAYSIFAKVLRSSWSLMYEKANGTLTTKTRSDRLLSTTVSWVIDESAIIASDSSPDAPASRSDILNSVRVTTHPRTVDEFPTFEVYHHPSAVLILAGATGMFIGGGAFKDPETDQDIGATAIQRISASIMTGVNVDYAAFDTAEGTGANRTADITITLLATNSRPTFMVDNGSGTDCWLTLLRLVGKRIRDLGASTYQAKDTTSIAKYGQRGPEIDMDYQANQFVGEGIAKYVKGRDGNPIIRPRTVTVRGITPALVTKMLIAEISDRVTVRETMIGANNDFFINHIERRLTNEGLLEQEMVLAPAVDPFGVSSYWQLGVAGKGELGNVTYLGL